MKTALVILCLVLIGCDQVKTAPQHARYQLATNATGQAWKIDSVTGEVWYCAVGGTGQIACYRAETR